MGPAELIVLTFPQETITAEAARALGALRTAGDIRVVDALVVTRRPDGTVQYGSSKPAAAGAAGMTTADEEGGFAGKWRTTDRTLHVKPTGRAHWTPYARYQLEGEKLLLTFNDGSRQVYHRTR